MKKKDKTTKTKIILKALTRSFRDGTPVIEFDQIGCCTFQTGSIIIWEPCTQMQCLRDGGSWKARPCPS